MNLENIFPPSYETQVGDQPLLHVLVLRSGVQLLCGCFISEGWCHLLKKIFARSNVIANRILNSVVSIEYSAQESLLLFTLRRQSYSQGNAILKWSPESTDQGPYMYRERWPQAKCPFEKLCFGLCSVTPVSPGDSARGQEQGGGKLGSDGNAPRGQREKAQWGGTQPQLQNSRQGRPRKSPEHFLLVNTDGDQRQTQTCSMLSMDPSSTDQWWSHTQLLESS